MSEIFTPKQERNGTTAEVATQNSALPGPMPDLSPMIDEAQSNAESFMELGHTIMVSGPGGTLGPSAPEASFAFTELGAQPPATTEGGPSSTSDVGDAK